MNHPNQIHLETTSHCNCKCIFCPVGLGKMTRQHGQMSWELFKKIVDEVGNQDIDWHLSLTSEPLLDPLLFDRIAYIDKVCPLGNMRLFTNGIAMTGDRLKKLAAAPIDVTVSIDATTPETYKKVKGVDLYEHVVANVLLFLSHRKLSVHFVTIPANENERHLFIEFWKKYNIRYSLSQCDTWNGEVPDWYHRGDPDPNKVCTSLETHLTIYWNGDVGICCRDHNAGFYFGNVDKEGVAGVWNNDKMKEQRERMRRKIWIGICRKCDVYRWQGGNA